MNINRALDGAEQRSGKRRWNIDWLVPQWPAPSQVKALCTTRAGGVSQAPYASLNLGSHVGDDLSHVQCNRSVLQEALGVKLVFLQQVHGTELLELTQSTPNDQSADAAFTRSAGLACTITVADCLPVLLCDLAGTMVAAVHAGWRGLAGLEGVGVLEQIHKQFVALTPVRPAQEATEVIAWLGPCIGASAFEVGSEVRLALVQGRPEAEHCFMPLSKGKWLADLPALARLRLKALGIERVFGNDGSAPWCTVSNPSRFFSYRRDHVCGRQAACIWLG